MSEHSEPGKATHEDKASPEGNGGASASGFEVTHVASPNLAPGDAKKPAVPRIESDAARAERARRAEHTGKLMLMAPPSKENFWQYKSWDEAINHPEADAEDRRDAAPGKPGRRMSALVAVVALAAITGAVGGALATGSLADMFGRNTGDVAAQTRSLNETVARMDTEIAALKLSIDKTGKLAAAQIAKTNDRLEKTGDRVEKVEKAQSEPLAKIAKLAESVEKLRVAPAPVVAAVTPKETPREVTGSISKPVLAAPKSMVARLPTVDGWVLHEVNDGAATIEGRSGLFEVLAGDPVPGVGRVEAVRRQDGRWVVVTNRGLIVSRP